MRNQPSVSRYELVVDGSVAGFVEYALARDVITLVHTEIDDAYEGRGLGSVLVRGVLDELRVELRAEPRRQVRSSCPFITTWLGRHPEYDDVLPAAGEPADRRRSRW